MLELINCKVSLYCLLCFPLYTICWWFSTLRVREEMKSKLSPWACEIKFASLQSATSIISYILLSLQSVTSICTKLTYQWGRTQKTVIGSVPGEDSNGNHILSVSVITASMRAWRLVREVTLSCPRQDPRRPPHSLHTHIRVHLTLRCIMTFFLVTQLHPPYS